MQPISRKKKLVIGKTNDRDDGIYKYIRIAIINMLKDLIKTWSHSSQVNMKHSPNRPYVRP